jgi:hypothetical protein
MTHAAPIRAPRAILCAALTLLVACGGGDEGGDGDNNGGNEPPPSSSFQIESGGNNVPERFSSDLWVHGEWAYTGTWGGTPRTGSPGDVIKVWSLDATGAPSLADSVNVPGVATVSATTVAMAGTARRIIRIICGSSADRLDIKRGARGARGRQGCRGCSW